MAEHTIHDDVLGTLKYDDRRHEFSGTVLCGDELVDIAIDFDSPADAVSETDISQARSAYLAFLTQKPVVETELVRQILDDCDNSWFQAGEPPIPDRFLIAIKPVTINIRSGFLDIVWYYDSKDYLVDGLAMAVHFNSDGTINRMGIWGG